MLVSSHVHDNLKMKILSGVNDVVYTTSNHSVGGWNHSFNVSRYPPCSKIGCCGLSNEGLSQIPHVFLSDSRYWSTDTSG